MPEVTFPATSPWFLAVLWCLQACTSPANGFASSPPHGRTLSVPDQLSLTHVLCLGTCKLVGETTNITHYKRCLFHITYQCRGTSPAQEVAVTTSSGQRFVYTTLSDGIIFKSTRNGDIIVIDVTINDPEWTHNGKWELGGKDYVTAKATVDLVGMSSILVATILLGIIFYFTDFERLRVEHSKWLSCQVVGADPPEQSYIQSTIDINLISNGQKIGIPDGPLRLLQNGTIVQDFLESDNPHIQGCHVEMKSVYSQFCHGSTSTNSSPSPTLRIPTGKNTDATSSISNENGSKSSTAIVIGVAVSCAAVVIVISTIIIIVRKSKFNRRQHGECEDEHDGIQATEASESYTPVVISTNNDRSINAPGVHRQATSEHQLSEPVVCSPTTHESIV